MQSKIFNIELRDWGWSSSGTQYGCETVNSTMPGFLHNKEWCMNDFDDIPIEEPEWNRACCEFLRVDIPGDDYTFMAQEGVTIY